MLERLREAFLSSQEQMNALIFQIMTFTGSFFMFVGAIYTYCEGMGWLAVLGMLLGSVVCLGLILYARHTKRYAGFSVILLLILDCVVLPYTYLYGGGIHSGMPLWMAVGLVAIMLMLRKKWRWIVMGLTLAVDAACVIYSYHFPERIAQLPDELSVYQDICVSFLIAVGMICFFVGVQVALFEHERDRFLRQQKLLDEALQTQSRFLANMSHEIRTPINTIIGLNEMTLREDISDEVAENSLHIQSASKMLLSVINDILDYSKIESSQMQLVPARYELANLCSEIVSMNWNRAHEKSLSFEVRISETLPSVLYGDETRIKQVINNLLSNAIKYTAEGSVTLAVDGETRSADQVLLRVSVSDTGMGIRKDDLEQLFEDFRRVNERETRGIEGTGLGLAISKQLVELMGGTITVDSIYHRGSIFTVTFVQDILDATPVGKMDYSSTRLNRPTRYRKSFDASQAKVLVVDDNEMNLLVARKLLRDSNVQLDVAMSGEECLQLTALNAYDMIFMDHIMPVMDGSEALQRIRAQVGGLNRETPVVALTANAMSGAKERYEKLGFSDYLAKPISSILLESMLLRWLPPSKVDLIGEELPGAVEGPVLRESMRRSRVVITTDSICDLPEDLMHQLGVAHLHYYVNTEVGHFEERSEIYTDSILEYIQQGGTAYSEPPAVGEYEEFFSRMLQQAEQVIHIAMGSGSGNGYANASRAANGFAHVTVIDSGHLSSGMGLVVMAAARLAMQNVDPAEIVRRTERMKAYVSTSFILEDPDALYHNGRLSKTVWRVSRYFSLHPILKMKHSKITFAGILAGDMEACSLRYVRRLMKGKRDIDTSVLFITHANAPAQRRERVLAEVAKYQKFERIYDVPASAAISSNCGAGCFGLLFCRKPPEEVS